MGGHVTGVVAEQWPKSYDGAMPICGVLGDYELFDFFLDFNVSAQTLSGVNKPYPYAADYLTATVPATKAGLGPAFPFAMNARVRTAGRWCRCARAACGRCSARAGCTGTGVAGDFLFGLGVGNGTLPRQPGMAVENCDVVYQFDTNLALSRPRQCSTAACSA